MKKHYFTNGKNGATVFCVTSISSIPYEYRFTSPYAISYDNRYSWEYFNSFKDARDYLTRNGYAEV